MLTVTKQAILCLIGTNGQPGIIVLMDRQKSETTQSSVHSRSELSQGQNSELEPGPVKSG